MKKTLLSLLIIFALVFSFNLAMTDVQATEYIRVGTAGAGGNYYNLGGAFTSTLNEIFDVDPDEIPEEYYNAPFMSTIQATQGSPHNVELVSTGQVEIAFGLAEPVWQGYHHVGGFEGRDNIPTENMRFVGYLYPNPYWFTVMEWAEDDIESIRDLEGKRVSVGMSGSTGELAWSSIMDYLDWDYDNIDQQFTVHGEAIDQVRNRQVDALLWPDAPGSPSYTEIYETGYARAYSYDEDIIEQQTEGTLAEPVTIPAGAVDGQENEFETYQDPAILIANKDVDDRIIYNFIKGVHDNKDTLVSIFPLANYLDVEEAHRGQPVPLHPGAKEFYEEEEVIDNFEIAPSPDGL